MSYGCGSGPVWTQINTVPMPDSNPDTYWMYLGSALINHQKTCTTGTYIFSWDKLIVLLCSVRWEVWRLCARGPDPEPWAVHRLLGGAQPQDMALHLRGELLQVGQQSVSTWTISLCGDKIPVPQPTESWETSWLNVRLETRRSPT